MAEITITIPDERVAELIDAINANHPVPVNPLGVPLHTPAQWARKWLGQTLKREVARHQTKLAAEAASVPEDDTLLDVT